MLTVKIEQMYPTREIIEWKKFYNNDLTMADVTENVERYIDNNLYRLTEKCPKMTELRWEFADYGQGHYRSIVVDKIKEPTVYTSKLTFDQMTDVMRAAVEYEDWDMVEQLSYQLRLVVNDFWRSESHSEFDLQLPMYEFDWMKTYDEVEVVDIDDPQLVIPNEIQDGDEYKTLLKYYKLGKIGFESNGQWITNPFYDETLRFQVDPLVHYGRELLSKWI